VRDVVEAVRQRGAKAVPLRLDVGESASFIAFREKVIAALGSEWKVSSWAGANEKRYGLLRRAIPLDKFGNYRFQRHLCVFSCSETGTGVK
jgi:hypothetical protein